MKRDHTNRFVAWLIATGLGIAAVTTVVAGGMLPRSEDHVRPLRPLPVSASAAVPVSVVYFPAQFPPVTRREPEESAPTF